MEANPHILISGSYSAFTDGFNGCGVYMASGLIPSSTFERPIYIGSSVDLRRRIVKNHIPDIHAGEHHNKPFSNYAVKYGLENVVWLLLEPCNPAIVVEREQYYLDLERPFADEFRGFNLAKDAQAPRKGRPLSDATKAKISQTKKGRRLSVATRQRMTAFRYRFRHSEKSKEKIGALKSRPFSLISPSGALIHGKNLMAFARKHGLPYSSIQRIARGERDSYKGWRKG